MESEGLAGLRDIVAACQVTITSPEDAVSVTAGPGNAVIALTLGARAIRLDGRTLGGLVVSTIREATRLASQQLAERARTLTPVDIAGTLAGALPDPVAAEFPTVDDDDEAPEMAARLRGIIDDARHQLVEYGSVRAELAALRVSATRDGITVTVRAGGGVDSVGIDDTELRRGPSVLGGLIVATIQTATAEAARQMAQLVQRITGPRLDIETMVASYQTDNHMGAQR